MEFLSLKEYKILLWQAIDGSVFNTLPVALMVKSDHATTFPSSWKQENVKSYISLSVNTRSHICSWLRSPKNDSLGVKSDPMASCSSAITNKPPLGMVWERCNGVLALKSNKIFFLLLLAVSVRVHSELEKKNWFNLVLLASLHCVPFSQDLEGFRVLLFFLLLVYSV